MQNIADLLAQFRKIENPVVLRKNVSTVLSDIVAFRVGEDCIKMHQGKLYIKANPAQKNLLFIRKEEVLKAVNGSFPDLGLRSIVFV